MEHFSSKFKTLVDVIQGIVWDGERESLCSNRTSLW